MNAGAVFGITLGLIVKCGEMRLRDNGIMYCGMGWLPKRDTIQASAIDFAMSQERDFYIQGEAGTGWMR